MEDAAAEDPAPPESWEVEDLDEALNRLMIKDVEKPVKPFLADAADPSTSGHPDSSCSSLVLHSMDRVPGSGVGNITSDPMCKVDQFLREALQNPRERLSVLRIEQDIEKFVCDPKRKQLEFLDLPTSYLRLAAHRVAQHYSLHSMVLLDSSLPDGSGSKIIICKTSDCRLPFIRLADIPVRLPSENAGSLVKLAIKQRPRERSQVTCNSKLISTKASNSKSMEERKEEYNKARARIFNSASFGSGSNLKRDGDPRLLDESEYDSIVVSKTEDKFITGIPDVNAYHGFPGSPSSCSRLPKTRTEKEHIGSYKPINKVAIFRDRELDKRDPDYDRSYDRYMQRFDPGFGFTTTPYAVQPLYSPALNYNTEFPQLVSGHQSQMPVEHQSQPLAQHLHGQWASPSAHMGIVYGHSESMMSPFNPPDHIAGRSASAMYPSSSQLPCRFPGLPFSNPCDCVQTFSQQNQQQSDASFGLARPW